VQAGSNATSAGAKTTAESGIVATASHAQDGNALPRTLRVCMHRPACDDPKQPENLAVAEMKVPVQSI